MFTSLFSHLGDHSPFSLVSCILKTTHFPVFVVFVVEGSIWSPSPSWPVLGARLHSAVQFTKYFHVLLPINHHNNGRSAPFPQFIVADVSVQGTKAPPLGFRGQCQGWCRTSGFPASPADQMQVRVMASTQGAGRGQEKGTKGIMAEAGLDLRLEWVTLGVKRQGPILGGQAGQTQG